jgi:hypothetical protein
MVKQVPTGALVKSILRVLHRLGPSGGRRRRRRRPRCRGHGRTSHRRPEPEVTLELDRLRWTGGDPGQDPHARHRSRSLTLGLGLLQGHRLLPPHHRPTGRWNPQIWPTLRGVAGNHLAPFMAWARAHTRLRKGNRYSHHRVRGKESLKRKKMTWSWSLL